MLSEGLQDKFDMNVLVCQPKGRGETCRINGVRVTRAGSLGTYWSMPVSISFAYILREQSSAADIVHVHLPFPLAALAWRGKKENQGLVVSYHADIVRQRWLEPLYGPSVRRLLDDADIIIVSSPNMVEASEWMQPHREKCRVVPFFVDVDTTPVPEQLLNALRNQLDIPPGLPVVLFVGRLVYYKGVDYLIRAMENVDATLLIVGTGPLEDHLKELALQVGVAARVRFLGEVSDETLRQCYQLSSCLVLPSVEPAEAFGLVQLEAMAFGKPVINTDLPTGVPFVSVDGETGITVQPRDVDALSSAIWRICEDDELRTRLGQAARDRVQAVFSREAVLDAVAGIYGEVLDRRS